MFSNLFKHRFLFSLINVYLHDILHPVYYLCSNDQKFENVILNLSFHTLFSSKFTCIMAFSGSSLVAQWSRIHLHCKSCSNQGSVPESRRSLEEGMATDSNTLAWRIPWTEESGGLQCIRSHRVGHEVI